MAAWHKISLNFNTSGSGWDSNAYWASVGAGAGAGAAVGGTLGVIAPALPTAATAACADGNCINEVQGAVQAANNVLTTVTADGDPTNEVSALAQAPNQVMGNARTLGQIGEKAAKIIKNTLRIPSEAGTAAYRVPDQLLPAQRLISEVKNVAYQSLTNQLKDFLAYAKKNDFTFELWVRETTTLSSNLQELIDKGDIIRRNLP